MNRRSFLSLAGAASLNPKYFFAPASGWHLGTSGIYQRPKMWVYSAEGVGLSRQDYERLVLKKFRHYKEAPESRFSDLVSVRY